MTGPGEPACRGPWFLMGGASRRRQSHPCGPCGEKRDNLDRTIPILRGCRPVRPSRPRGYGIINRPVSPSRSGYASSLKLLSYLNLLSLRSSSSCPSSTRPPTSHLALSHQQDAEYTQLCLIPHPDKQITGQAKDNGELSPWRCPQGLARTRRPPSLRALRRGRDTACTPPKRAPALRS